MSILQAVMTAPLMSGGAPTYTLTPPALNVDEGSSLTFTVGGTNISNGTYYWTIETNAGDVTESSGSFAITGNSGTFSVTPTADATTEGVETFIVYLRSDSITGSVLASETITINDTSLTYTGTDYLWTGDSNAWTQNGTFLDNSAYSDPAPTNPAYTYPDGSTGKTRNFDGDSWILSPSLTTGNGAWNGTAIAINFWFYPTSPGIQLLTELGQPQLSADYHTTLLEISSAGNIKARFWQVGGGIPQVITSSNTVVIDQWNHIYFAEDTNGAHTFALNGVATTSLPTYTRSPPLTEYFAVGGSDTTNMGNTVGFQGLVGYLKISDYAVGSNFTSTKNKFRSILTTGESLGFSGSEQDVQVTGTRTDWALGNTWTIEWWEKMDADADGFHGVMSQDSNQDPYPGLDVFHANGSIQMFNGGWNFTEPARGQWNHIAIQKNGATATAYINGVATSVSANMTYGTLSNTSQDLIIGLRSANGATPGYSQWFKGQLANIRISNVVRYSNPFQAPITVAVDANTVLALEGAPGSSGMLDDVSASNHTITNNNTTIVTID
jgi:hypothetical protein